eukprot:TRINITY_DN17908_c1_g1_i1.p1 TRINITY_DN17908_c1_g1~~TRINITY_DN17908_c1_g1_i1.p1  ORF type:complete len:350 (+),score=57.56 TRINITY_DN17908_c1_g1_i1:25-1050(+)
MRPPVRDHLVKEWLAQRHPVSTAGMVSNYTAWKESARSLNTDLNNVRKQNKSVGEETARHALKVFGCQGHSRDAKKMFNLVKNHNTEDYRMLLTSIVKGGLTTQGGDETEVKQIFDEMNSKNVKPDTGCYRLLARHLGRNGADQEVVKQVTTAMENDGVPPDVWTMNEIVNYEKNVASALRTLKNFELRYNVHPNSATLCALLRVCKGSNDIRSARKLMKQLPHKDTEVWNSYLRVLNTPATHRLLLEAFEKTPLPNAGSYAIVISSCGHTHNEELAEKYFSRMVDKGFLKGKGSIGSMMEVYAATRNKEKAEKLMAWSVDAGIPPSAATQGLYTIATSGE